MKIDPTRGYCYLLLESKNQVTADLKYNQSIYLKVCFGICSKDFWDFSGFFKIFI